MELKSSFELPVDRAEAWRLLTDLERVAPCIPGVTVESADAEQLSGVMRVKLGPISSSYKTEVRLAERDDASFRAVLEARGRELRGQGTATATVTATVGETDAGALVELDTRLAVTGRAAQFGRGVLAEVADNLVNQFVERLEREGLTQEPAGAQPGEAGAAAAPPADERALDLGAALAGTRVARRLGVAGAGAVAIVLLYLFGRRR